MRGWLALQPLDFSDLQFRLDCSDHTFSNVILKLEDVSELSLKAIRPDVYTCRGIDELPVILSRLPLRRTLPSSTYRTPRSRPTCRISILLPL